MPPSCCRTVQARWYGQNQRPTRSEAPGQAPPERLRRSPVPDLRHITRRRSIPKNADLEIVVHSIVALAAQQDGIAQKSVNGERQLIGFRHSDIAPLGGHRTRLVNQQQQAGRLPSVDLSGVHDPPGIVLEMNTAIDTITHSRMQLRRHAALPTIVLAGEWISSPTASQPISRPARLDRSRMPPGRVLAAAETIGRTAGVSGGSIGAGRPNEPVTVTARPSLVDAGRSAWSRRPMVRGTPGCHWLRGRRGRAVPWRPGTVRDRVASKPGGPSV
jgi:hypothetical protein